MSGDDWQRRCMFSDEDWRSLTKYYPGLEKQPPAVSRMAFNIVEWERKKKPNFKPSLPGGRKDAYLGAAKKISAAIESVKAALEPGQSGFEVFPGGDGPGDIDSRNNFFRNLVSNMKICENEFSGAVQRMKLGKTGPHNPMLKTYVWLVADWFERNGRSDRISAGEESHSLKVFIKDIFKHFDFIPQDRALADAIRSYQKKRIEFRMRFRVTKF